MIKLCNGKQVKSDYYGYNTLSSLYHEILNDAAVTNIYARTITIPSWFDGNLCAPLGVIIRWLQRHNKKIKLKPESTAIDRLLGKNGFYENFVENPRIKDDTYHTTIQCREFLTKDYDAFSIYLNKRIPRDRLPKMSDKLWNTFIDTLAELFSNASTHSETQLIVACGQSYPKSQKIDFSIADAGIGFKNRLMKSNVLEQAALQSDDDKNCIKAIEWALQKGRSTKMDISGGLGMYLLREFITLNKGKLQIISDKGYWEQNTGRVTKAILDHPFPGTVINLEIDTSDQAAYCLLKE